MYWFNYSQTEIVEIEYRLPNGEIEHTRLLHWRSGQDDHKTTSNHGIMI
jgi:hypothetical protein